LNDNNSDSVRSIDSESRTVPSADGFTNRCVDCGEIHETFHHYESYRCPDCIESEQQVVTDGGERESLPLEEFSHTTAPEWALLIADDLDLNRTATTKARQFARDHGLNGDTSRRPRSVASGAVYLAAALHNDKRNQAEVAEVADVSTVTVATCYQEIAEAEGLISDSRPDSDARCDGGTTERPGFVDPNTEYVRCHFCGQTWDPTVVDGMDLSDEDEYYPGMVPVCPEHAGGCR
jgi:DNA-directed RNA polymerase subunit RPC12/RpoP